MSLFCARCRRDLARSGAWPRRPAFAHSERSGAPRFAPEKRTGASRLAPAACVAR